MMATKIAALRFIRLLAAFLVALPAVAPLSCVAGAAGMGERLAQHGNNLIPACDVCHGAQGQGDSRAGYPKLAGLDADYLQRQMLFYQQGERHNAVMQQYAIALSEAQIRAVAAYYAHLPAPLHAAIDTQSPSAQLLTQGNIAQGIPACFGCHGAQGGGNTDGIPSIAGQPPIYFIDQMNAWRTGQRMVAEGDPMQTIAKSLTRNQIINLAHLLQ